MRVSTTVLTGLIMWGLGAGMDAAAQGRARGQTRVPIRFAEMDTNKDRVITRKEWRGSDQSFRVHDWNDDDILSGEEVRVGGRRQTRTAEPDFDSPEREYEFDDWTARGFASVDHNKDGRITPAEWHFDRESFRRADWNRDNVLTREEFLGTNPDEDDDREDRFRTLDQNRDNRISRDEWHGTRARFDALDDDKNGFLTRAEVVGTTDAPPDLFTSVDINRDGIITSDEWHWSRASFNALDVNNDNRLSRAEFAGTAAEASRSAAFRAGVDRGVIEGRQAGREDRQRNVWDLEGQRELETADSGYLAAMGPRAEYQAGYRQGFRRGYREGFGPR